MNVEHYKRILARKLNREFEKNMKQVFKSDKYRDLDIKRNYHRKQADMLQKKINRMLPDRTKHNNELRETVESFHDEYDKTVMIHGQKDKKVAREKLFKKFGLM